MRSYLALRLVGVGVCLQLQRPWAALWYYLKQGAIGSVGLQARADMEAFTELGGDNALRLFRQGRDTFLAVHDRRCLEQSDAYTDELAQRLRGTGGKGVKTVVER